MTDADPRRLMLNLGAGLQYLPGWTNYDRSRVTKMLRWPAVRTLVWLAGRLRILSVREVHEWPDQTYCHDLTKGIPHRDGAADVIYTSHLLEHVRPDQAIFILRECHRVLKPEGVLRVVVPDLRLLAERYLAGDRAFFGDDDNLIGDAFVRALHLRPDPRGRRVERAVRKVARTDDGGHRWMYDAESMAGRLVDAGFRDVEVLAYRESRDAAAAKLDSRPRDSLHIEGRK